MSNLLSIAELAWKQLFPNPGAQNAVSKGEFVATAKVSMPISYGLKVKMINVRMGILIYQVTFLLK